LSKTGWHVDVLCVGFACFDLVFSVNHHPGPDEKMVADALLLTGGGPAANAAVGVTRLGLKSAFAGYLGDDICGHLHLEELKAAGVATELIVRGSAPTPISSILIKPAGQRSVINYRGATRPLDAHQLPSRLCLPKVILFDGHQVAWSTQLLETARRHRIPTVLDAGSVHSGTQTLMGRVDHLVASQTFAEDFTSESNVHRAARALAHQSPSVVITCGEKGVVWKNRWGAGAMDAFPIAAADTTGAGDAFHGAFAAGLAKGLGWQHLLRYASAAGALCCTRAGARPALPDKTEVQRLLALHPAP
jgi:sulfofructose kinase